MVAVVSGGERRRRCMVPVREQWPWPWWPWSEPCDRVRLEGERKERNEEGKVGAGGGWRKKVKERDGSGWPDPVFSVTLPTVASSFNPISPFLKSYKPNPKIKPIQTNSFKPNPISHKSSPKLKPNQFTFHINWGNTPKFSKLHFNPKFSQNYILTPKLPKSHFGPKFPKNHILTPKPYKHSSQAIQAILLKLYKQSWGIFYKPYKYIGINPKLKFIYLYLIVLFFS